MTRPVTLLFAAPAADWTDYAGPLAAALVAEGIAAEVLTRTDRPETVDYLIYAPGGPVSDFTPFTGAKAVLSLWAGVERIVTNPTLTQPLVRMVDPVGLTEGMVEWVVGHVLRHHLGMDRYIVNPAHRWDPVVPKLARDRVVTVLGLGELGGACATALAGLNFRVRGWSRRPKDVPGIETFDGEAGLTAALSGAEIVVLLLPLTAGTADLLDAGRLTLLAPRAAVLNPGRGPLIDDAALLAALDSGQIGHATLDVFRTEPLPAAHPFWTHPGVTVTPHIAAATRPESAARQIARSIREAEDGKPLSHLVDRAAGY